MKPILRNIQIVLLLLGGILVAQNKSITENHPPVFISQMPDTALDAGMRLQFKYVATDADGDKLRFGHSGSLPSGATINDSTGLFYWVPSTANAGIHHIIILVSDGKVTTQSRISRISVYISQIYDCTITLLSNPAEGGKYAWSQQFHFKGDTATVKASPNKGYRFLNWTEDGVIVSTDSNYTFIVKGDRKLVANFRINHAPVFVAELKDTLIWAGKLLIFQYKAVDPDGDSVKYYAKSILPKNSLLNQTTGVFTWRPANQQRGFYELIIEANDGNERTLARRAILSTDYNFDCFEPNCIGLAIAHNIGGEVSSSHNGDTTIVRAISYKGYLFTNWTERGEVVSTDSVYKFILTGRRDLLANFSPITSLRNKYNLPVDYKLEQNYPNPFNPVTTISYSIPKAGRVTLKVFDMLGREVAKLVDEYKQPGRYSVEFRTKSEEYTSGVYIYQIQSGSYSESKKLILLK